MVSPVNSISTSSFNVTSFIYFLIVRNLTILLLKLMIILVIIYTATFKAISPSPRSTTPSMGGNSQSNAVNDKKQDITIVIHAAPGQDVNQLADLVAQKLNRAKAAIKRGSMLDAGYAQ
jgi:hypothetical protein